MMSMCSCTSKTKNVNESIDEAGSREKAPGKSSRTQEDCYRAKEGLICARGSGIATRLAYFINRVGHIREGGFKTAPLP